MLLFQGELSPILSADADPELDTVEGGCFIMTDVVRAVDLEAIQNVGQMP